MQWATLERMQKVCKDISRALTTMGATNQLVVPPVRWAGRREKGESDLMYMQKIVVTRDSNERRDNKYQFSKICGVKLNARALNHPTKGSQMLAGPSMGGCPSDLGARSGVSPADIVRHEGSGKVDIESRGVATLREQFNTQMRMGCRRKQMTGKGYNGELGTNLNGRRCRQPRTDGGLTTVCWNGAGDSGGTVTSSGFVYHRYFFQRRDVHQKGISFLWCTRGGHLGSRSYSTDNHVHVTTAVDDEGARDVVGATGGNRPDGCRDVCAASGIGDSIEERTIVATWMIPG
ncbi:hypothetical protein BU15DRAFT_67421 [Melanogaster broomeanus]|nr:hypothetical protein BU15DRAFT_67421 [Melanogaster broomeanus]